MSPAYAGTILIPEYRLLQAGLQVNVFWRGLDKALPRRRLGGVVSDRASPSIYALRGNCYRFRHPRPSESSRRKDTRCDGALPALHAYNEKRSELSGITEPVANRDQFCFVDGAQCKPPIDRLI